MAAASFFCVFAPSAIRRGISQEVVLEYAQWKQTFGKLYATPAEQDYRLEVFASQKTFVDESNADYSEKVAAKGETLSGPMFALNMFADLTEEEFVAKYTSGPQSANADLYENEPQTGGATPTTVPKVQNSGLAQTAYQIRIRNQGSCGSCWSFAGIALFEKLYFDRTRQRLDLSQQEVLDCDTASMGCNGGYEHRALQYIYANGVNTYGQYPYQGAQGGCRRQAANRVKIAYAFWWNNFSTGQASASSGKGTHATLSLYSSGKFRYMSNVNDVYDASTSGECGLTMNHFINMASIDSSKVLTVFNSWGTGWGAGGYKRIRPCNDGNFWGAGTRIAWAE